MARKPTKSGQPSKPKARKGGTGQGATSTAKALQRRQILKGVVAGSSVVASAMTLPREWTKPVIQSIVASAQAQVSPPIQPPAPAPSLLPPLIPLPPPGEPPVIAPQFVPEFM